jgi:hypothetical protein
MPQFVQMGNQSLREAKQAVQEALILELPRRPPCTSMRRHRYSRQLRRLAEFGGEIAEGADWPVFCVVAVAP